MGYLSDCKNAKNCLKEKCFGCEACVQICGKHAICMKEDQEGFRYPVIDMKRCVQCGLCEKVCPYENPPFRSTEPKVAFGGYHKDIHIRGESTSGGAFTAIVNVWCDDNYVVLGAASEGLTVYHDFITDKASLNRIRKSKYSQSIIGSSYQDAKRFLLEGKKVLFSGTPCQIAGLKCYLGSVNQEKLLTVEVVCEGVPSPLFVRSFDTYLRKTKNLGIAELDYRYKDMKPVDKPIYGRWDFQVMRVVLENGKVLRRDRWINPFWSIWLNHLMSRPSCYHCPFATTDRVADITLGDLWGVHLYCPELYGNNCGASLIVCNTAVGRSVLEQAKRDLQGHALDFETALRYQGPMRKCIPMNPERERFVKDLKNMDYQSLCRKWAKKPSIRLLYSKYVWGNRQKVAMWNLKHCLKHGCNIELNDC